MKRYIAFLRGINISGKNKVSMAELKQGFERLDYTDVFYKYGWKYDIYCLIPASVVCVLSFGSLCRINTSTLTNLS